jgi:hypothetical protein
MRIINTTNLIQKIKSNPQNQAADFFWIDQYGLLNLH